MGGTFKFLTGAAVGFLAGILLAPKSGAETREFIKEKAQAYMDNADVMADNAKDKAVELYSSASGYAGDAGSQIKTKIEAARGKLSRTGATDALGDATTEATEAAAGVADAAKDAASA